MNILLEINKLLPAEWYLEHLSRLGDGDWQALVGDGTDIHRGTGDSIEEAIGNAVVGSPIGTIFATSYDESKPKIDIMAIISNRLPKLRRLR